MRGYQKPTPNKATYAAHLSALIKIMLLLMTMLNIASGQSSASVIGIVETRTATRLEAQGLKR